MEIRGKVIQKFGLESGTTKTGKDYKKQHILIETIETYPKKVFIEFFGAKVDELSNVYPGATVTVSINIESRAWNDKWFTTVSGWKVAMESAAAAPQQAQPEPEFPESFIDDVTDEDLPF